MGRGKPFSGTACLIAAVLLCLGVVAASAHHGPGAYDRTQEITVTGTVTRFEFVNPHVLIFIGRDDADNGAPALFLNRVVAGDGRVLTSSGR